MSDTKHDTVCRYCGESQLIKLSEVVHGVTLYACYTRQIPVDYYGRTWIQSVACATIAFQKQEHRQITAERDAAYEAIRWAYDKINHDYRVIDWLDEMDAMPAVIKAKEAKS